MDIQVASNFERLIYDLNNFNDVETRNIMKGIKEEGKYIIPKEKLEKIKKDFLSASMNEDEVIDTIKEVYKKHNIMLDPHSAIGFGALKKVNIDGNNVVLATAHPSKFPDAIDKSISIKPSLPKELMYVMNEKENYDIISNNLNKIKQYIKEKIR
jgi:threonine synthase